MDAVEKEKTMMVGRLQWLRGRQHRIIAVTLFSLLAVTATTSASAQNVFPLPNGNVGIGTTNPAALLHVVGQSRFDTAEGTTGIGSGILIQLRNLNGTNNDYAGMMWLDGTSTTTNYYGVQFRSHANYSGDFYWANNCLELMRLTAGGNVAIGMTSPATALDVSGTTRVM